MATSARNRRLEPAYKQHTVVVDLRGVVLDVAVTTGATNEGQMIAEQLGATAATTGQAIKTATADAGYAYGRVYGGLEQRGGVIAEPAQRHGAADRLGFGRDERVDRNASALALLEPNQPQHSNI